MYNQGHERCQLFHQTGRQMAAQVRSATRFLCRASSGPHCCRTFRLSVGYLRVLRHQFRHEKIDFSEAVAEGSRPRRRIDAATRQKIVAWRQRELSAGDIAQLLHQEAIDISVRTIERILAEEGFKKLPRRTQLKIGRTIGGSEVPEAAAPVAIERLEGNGSNPRRRGVSLRSIHCPTQS